MPTLCGCNARIWSVAQLSSAGVAACALVAQADGWVTAPERRRMLDRMSQSPSIRFFGLHEVTVGFEALNIRFDLDIEDGEAAAEALGLVEALAALELEDVDLVFLAVLDDFGGDLGPGDVLPTAPDDVRLVAGLTAEEAGLVGPGSVMAWPFLSTSPLSAILISTRSWARRSIRWVRRTFRRPAIRWRAG